MSISKEEYILKSLRKISHKEWEAFVITRILHGLDDDEIEFVTQQLVRRDNGKRALTDLYFPQLSLHIEIDEPHHMREDQVKDDEKREQDIVQATDHKIERIKIANNDGTIRSLSHIRADVDKLINLIAKLKQSAISDGSFIPWDFELRYSADPVIEKGHASVDDNVVFHTQIEALRCFGFKGKGYQRGAWTIPDGSNDTVWFPRLYQHGIWHNELTDGGKTIYERAINKDGVLSIAKQRNAGEQHPEKKYIVFAKARDSLGFNLLRYVGTFKMNFEKSTLEALRFDRISTIERIRQ